MSARGRVVRTLTAPLAVPFAAVAALAVLLLGGCGAAAATDGTPSPSPRTPTPTPWSSAPASAPSEPSLSPRFAAPALVDASIPYGADRQQQMATYSERRYGIATATLEPTAIVLHFTESNDDPWSTINFFASNVPEGGSLPGVCTHFVVDKAGIVYQLVPTDLRCRHTIGLNHVALGIEVVQATEGHSSAWADAQILARPAQIDAVLDLVRWLQHTHSIGTDRIIGHGTANEDPAFLDLTGMRNDHTDFGPDAIAEVRQRLDALP